jgi:hypothetical protein
VKLGPREEKSVTESQLKAYDEPLMVRELNGEVVLTGPGALTAALTPEAAEKTAKLMLAAADQALAFKSSGKSPDGSHASQLSPRD